MRTAASPSVGIGLNQAAIPAFRGNREPYLDECKRNRWGRASLSGMDDDLASLTPEELIAEVKRLRTGIRRHRDSSGHDLCWHHPQLWGLLPEKLDPEIAVPPWPKFLRGCIRYREALDREAPDAPVEESEFE
jgi:hypothetical protein